jgi:protein archease
MVHPERDAPAGGAAAGDTASRGDAASRDDATGPAREQTARRGQAPRRGSVAEADDQGPRLSPTPSAGVGAGFELLEHTADIGILARGATLAEAFEQATWGLAEVQGAPAPGPEAVAPGPMAGPEEAVAVRVSASDAGGLLVDWLNEVLWLREVRDAVVAGVRVERVGEGTASGAVVLAAGGAAVDGTFVKAVTYHRLRVEPDPGGGWVAEVYLDV